MVHIIADFDSGRIDVFHFPGAIGLDHHAGVFGDLCFHPGSDNRRFGDQQRYRLPLHVRTHQGPVGVIVFKKRNQPGGHTNHLCRRDVHVADFLGVGQFKVRLETGDDVSSQGFAANDVAALIDFGISRGHISFGLLVRSQPRDFLGDPPAFNN